MGGRGSNSGTYNGMVIKATRNLIKLQINIVKAAKALRRSAKMNDDYQNVIGDALYPYDMDEAVKYANPNYGKNSRAYTYNCVKSVVAYELLRRGYDVEALPYTGLDDPCVYLDAMYVAVKGFKAKSVGKTDVVKGIKNAIIKMPDGARALVGLKSPTLNHVVVAENTSAGVRYFDPQSGIEIDMEKFVATYGFSGAVIGRIDNKDLSNAITEYVKKR